MSDERNARITFEVYTDEKYLLQHYLPHGFLAILGRFWVSETLKLFQEKGIKETTSAILRGNAKIVILPEKKK